MQGRADEKWEGPQRQQAGKDCMEGREQKGEMGMRKAKAEETRNR